MHSAHLRLAEEAREHLGLQYVRWVPSGQPGHRGAPIASAADRLSMLRAALANHAEFVGDDGEFRSKEPTYTVNTLARIRRETGAETPLVLIIGGDQFLGLETWKDWRHLFDLAHIAVAERPGHAIDTARLTSQLAAEYASRAAGSVSAQPAGTIIRFPMAALDISSTAVRQLIASGRSPRYLLPEYVLEYIHARHLYRKVST